MDGAKADLVITDSPYNVPIDGHARRLPSSIPSEPNAERVFLILYGGFA
jgi:hypothetical protein